MVYLESFRLPPDDWTDCYLSMSILENTSDKVLFLNSMKYVLKNNKDHHKNEKRL